VGNPKRSSDTFQDAADTDNPQFVTALGRGMAILRCFDQGASPHLGNQDIATRTGLAKPTVSRLTFTLASLGYLNYSVALEKYSLGPGVLALAHAFVKGNDIMAVARPLMQALAAHTKAAVMLGACHESHMVLLDICQGDEIFQLKLEAGSRVPHSSTALGRAWLASLPQGAFERYLEKLRTLCPAAGWPGIKSGLVRARRDYERYGFCFSLGDWNPEVFAVGVPIVSADQSRVFAFNVSGRVSVVTREQLVNDFGPRLVVLRNEVLERVQGRF
jgi:DNA-binding IclR family transcriptional regulator